MRSGYLSGYFISVAAKRLSAVEVDPGSSNQHEFNGSRELKRVFPEENRKSFEARFLYLDDNETGLTENGTITWYDARERHPTRSEFRLYFSGNGIMSMASEGNTLFIARRTDGVVMLIIVEAGSTIEGQICYLFGIDRPSGRLFEQVSISADNDHELDFATRYILDELGVDVEEPEADRLDNIIERFGLEFPKTSIFSALARDTIAKEFSVQDDPDHALVSLMNWEEKLFRRLERHIVADRLRQGFGGEDPDVDGFINFSLSVQNRRKSRAGFAFEDHLSFIFSTSNLSFSRQVITENRSKPDFIFPGILQYRDPMFSAELLTMLGVKTSCKDRWRQVLSEAARVERKHLLTLEPSISSSQTDEMRAHHLQLVIPHSLHSSFSESQRSWLMNLKDFIRFVGHKQHQ